MAIVYVDRFDWWEALQQGVALADLDDLLAGLERPAWMARAACRGMGTAAFFGPEPAVAVCTACPVRTACAAYAEANDEQAGVWGGVERRPPERPPESATPRVATLDDLGVDQPTAALIAELAAAGRGAMVIARRLNLAGSTPPPGERRWWPTNVRAVQRALRARD